MADGLAKIARLRRLEAAAAKRDLASALTAERIAQRALVQAQAAVVTEARVNLPVMSDCFAAWLPAAVEAIAGRKSAELQAAVERDAARQVLAQCLAAQRAVDTVLAEREASARMEVERRSERTHDATRRQGRLFFCK